MKHFKTDRQDNSLTQLMGLATGLEPSDVRTYLAQLKEDTPYVTGSPNPLVGPIYSKSARDGLYLPSTFVPAGLKEYIVVYLTASDYLPTQLGKGQLEVLRLCFELSQSADRTIPRLEMLTALAVLNHLAHNPTQEQQFLEQYERQLSDVPRNRLRVAMRGTDGGARRAFLYRQAILHTMRAVLASDEPPRVNHKNLIDGDVLKEATLKCHGMAGLLGPSEDTDESHVLGVQALAFMYLICSDLFNRQFTHSREILPTVARYLRLWTNYGRVLRKHRARRRPTALLDDATGLRIEEILGFALALFGHASRWRPGQPIWLEDDFAFSRLSAESKDAFITLVSDPIDEMSTKALNQRSEWDFLQFQTAPVLRNENRLLVLDETLLIQRVLSGLFWIVHDHEKTQHGETARHRWTQDYAEMIELLAEDQIRSMAPRVGGFGKDATYYTEDDLRRAYGTRACDAAIHFGTGLCLFEIVSGRVKIQTRVEGSLLAFEQDIQRLVVKKAEQLDTSATAILANEPALTGHPATQNLTILPVLIVGEDFPNSPAAQRFIDDTLARESLLQMPKVGPLTIIDLADLEMLEGLMERGTTPLEVLFEWKTSKFQYHPLRNFLIATYGRGYDFQSSRLRGEMNSAFNDIVDAMRLRID